MRTRRSPRNQERLYKAIGADLAKAAAPRAFCTNPDCQTAYCTGCAPTPEPTPEPKEPGPSLYDDVVRLGIPHASHASDLYLPQTAQVIELLTQHGKRIDGWSVSRFVNRVEADRAIAVTWLDVAFAYQPYWRMKQLQKEVRRR